MITFHGKSFPWKFIYVTVLVCNFILFYDRSFRVCKAIADLQEELIGWPDNPRKVAQAFYQIDHFPGVIGAIDGTHVLMCPPEKDEQEYLNRHSTHSFNVCAVAGPTYMFYYVNSGTPGRSHDGGVLRRTTLWRQWEVEKFRPFHGAVILGDSAYPLTDWMMTPFRNIERRPLTSAQKRYQTAHARTRSVVERAFGVLKMRFRALFKSGLRVMGMMYGADIITACVILHNLCIAHNDNISDFLRDLHDHFPPPPSRLNVHTTHGRRAEQDDGVIRRENIVQSFQ